MWLDATDGGLGASYVILAFSSNASVSGIVPHWIEPGINPQPENAICPVVYSVVEPIESAIVVAKGKVSDGDLRPKASAARCFRRAPTC